MLVIFQASPAPHHACHPFQRLNSCGTWKLRLPVECWLNCCKCEAEASWMSHPFFCSSPVCFTAMRHTGASSLYSNTTTFLAIIHGKEERKPWRPSAASAVSFFRGSYCYTHQSSLKRERVKVVAVARPSTGMCPGEKKKATMDYPAFFCA